MKAGALDFMTKPFNDQDLLDVVQQALDRDRVKREQRAAAARLRRCCDSLEMVEYAARNGFASAQKPIPSMESGLAKQLGVNLDQPLAAA